MERDAQLKALHEFIETEKLKEPREFFINLSEALYTCNERDVFGETRIDSSDAMWTIRGFENQNKRNLP